MTGGGSWPEISDYLSKLVEMVDNVTEGVINDTGEDSVPSIVVKQESEAEIEAGLSHILPVTERDLTDGGTFNLFISNPEGSGMRLSGAGTAIRAGGRGNLHIYKNVEKTADGTDEQFFNVLIGDENNTDAVAEKDISFTGGTQIADSLLLGGNRNFTIASGTEVSDFEILPGNNLLFVIENDSGRTEDFQIINQHSDEGI